MGVDIQRRFDIGVAEQLFCSQHVHAGLIQHTGVSVAELMRGEGLDHGGEAAGGEAGFQCAVLLLRLDGGGKIAVFLIQNAHIAFPHSAPGRLGIDAAGGIRAEVQRFVRLARQKRHEEIRNVDQPHSGLGLRHVLDMRHSVDEFGAFIDADRFFLQIDVAPGQGDQLPAADAGIEHHHGGQPRGVVGLFDPPALLLGDRLPFLRRGAMWDHDGRAGVEIHDAVVDGKLEDVVGVQQDIAEGFTAQRLFLSAGQIEQELLDLHRLDSSDRHAVQRRQMFAFTLNILIITGGDAGLLDGKVLILPAFKGVVLQREIDPSVEKGSGFVVFCFQLFRAAAVDCFILSFSVGVFAEVYLFCVASIGAGLLFRHKKQRLPFKKVDFSKGPAYNNSADPDICVLGFGSPSRCW